MRFVLAALAVVLTQAAQLMESADSLETQQQIAAEANEMANRIRRAFEIPAAKAGQPLQS